MHWKGCVEAIRGHEEKRGQRDAGSAATKDKEEKRFVGAREGESGSN